MQINPHAATARVRSASAHCRWFAARGLFKRGPAPIWSSEAEVLRALGEDRPPSRGSPAHPPERPVPRPRF